VLVEKIGQRSLTLSLLFLDAQGDEAARVKSVHVAVNKMTRQKIPLPSMVKTALKKDSSMKDMDRDL